MAGIDVLLDAAHEGKIYVGGIFALPWATLKGIGLDYTGGMRVEKKKEEEEELRACVSLICICFIFLLLEVHSEVIRIALIFYSLSSIQECFCHDASLTALQLYLSPSYNYIRRRQFQARWPGP